MTMKTDFIKFNGRYEKKNNHFYIFNGGSGISFRMNGPSFKLYLKSSPVDCYIYVIIDRDYESKTKLLVSDKPIVFSLKEGPHDIDIVKANEINDNILELVDLEVEGELLPYEHSYSKKVRVFGDSTIAGYGILSHTGEASIHTSDSVRDFCFRALYEMNIEMDVFSASGYGLVFSIYTQPNRNGIINYINKVAVDKTVDYVDNGKYDLLIISLGTNDTSYIAESPTLREERINEFKESYKRLIDSELSKNPDLKILMIYGTLKEEYAYYLVDATYEYLKPFYKNLYIHKFNGDNTGINGHAYVDGHDSMAEELKNVIQSILY